MEISPLEINFSMYWGMHEKGNGEVNFVVCFRFRKTFVGTLYKTVIR